MKNHRLITLTILFIPTTASAQSVSDTLGLAGIFIAALALLWAFKLRGERQGLENQLTDKWAEVRRLQGEIQELKKRRLEGEKPKEGVDVRLEEEMKKAKSEKPRAEGLRNEYWDRLERMKTPSRENPELKKLKEERDEIQNMVEITKVKYHTRAIDEKTFADITEDYQRRLIEIEGKMRRLQG